MRHMHGSTGPLSHELYLAPEVRLWDHLDPHHSQGGGLHRPAGDAEVLATDIWTLGVVFWQMLTLHLFKTLGAIPAVRASTLAQPRRAWRGLRAWQCGSIASAPRVACTSVCQGSEPATCSFNCLRQSIRTQCRSPVIQK